jgi:hypothetical protein
MAVNAVGISAAAPRPEVTSAIQRAAATTGTNFQYLLATAKMESNFAPSAAATTSSARGLFQFIDQTWLGTVKEAGARLGYGQYADAISRTGSGSYEITDSSMRSAIMKLRDDPTAASAMAGILTRSNSMKLTGAIGRQPTDAELYMAHFMGVRGASKLINAAAATPDATGAALFPRAAAANRSIFYDKAGGARSISGVYAELSRRYDAAANSQGTQLAMGASTGTLAPMAVASVGTIQPVASVTPAAAPREPLFQSLYQAGPRAEPVSPAVRNLWASGASTSAAPQQQRDLRAPQRLDLFSDRFGTFAG